MVKIFKILKIFFLILLFTTSSAFTAMTIHYRPARNTRDMIFVFEKIILKAALNKTKKMYGDFQLIATPNMNTRRSLLVSKNNSFKNYIFHTALNNNLVKEYSHIPIPFMKGLTGYRLFFTSKRINKKLKMVKSVQDLKAFSMGQGQGWSDNTILRASGFTVFEHHRYETLFPKVANNRFDLFPRGVNEILAEYEHNKDLKNLVINKDIALYYPFPRVFYTNKKNKLLIERITKGLEIMINDGTFDKLWNHQFSKTLTQLNLKKIKIIPIENPLLKGLNKSYLKYLKTFH